MVKESYFEQNAVRSQGQFEWDDAKSESNARKHGVTFDEARLIWLGRVLEIRADRRGEARWLSFGRLDGRIIAVAWTPRDGARRIISARQARRGRERKDYEAFAGRSEVREPD